MEYSCLRFTRQGMSGSNFRVLISETVWLRIKRIRCLHTSPQNEGLFGSLPPLFTRLLPRTLRARAYISATGRENLSLPQYTQSEFTLWFMNMRG